ncbi:MAG: hypothetical protein SP4CHLAM5_00720 [Chlamydiia bacterium]|nr:hypothetical protein [Chlamydiia bacterium]
METIHISRRNVNIAAATGSIILAANIRPLKNIISKVTIVALTLLQDIVGCFIKALGSKPKRLSKFIDDAAHAHQVSLILKEKELIAETIECAFCNYPGKASLYVENRQLKVMFDVDMESAGAVKICNISNREISEVSIHNFEHHDGSNRRSIDRLHRDYEKNYDNFGEIRKFAEFPEYIGDLARGDYNLAVFLCENIEQRDLDTLDRKKFGTLAYLTAYCRTHYPNGSSDGKLTASIMRMNRSREIIVQGDDGRPGCSMQCRKRIRQINSSTLPYRTIDPKLIALKYGLNLRALNTLTTKIDSYLSPSVKEYKD